MRHGVRRGVAAALGIVLLLGAGETPAVANDDPEQPAKIRNQGTTCDTSPGAHQPFYGEPSASQKYDQRFSQLGTQPIPNLGNAPSDANWIPQGLAYWPNWDSRGNDVLLVTAYRERWPSMIHALDAKTGERVGKGTLWIKEGHASGASVLGDWLFVSGEIKKKRGIRKYRLSDLRKKLLAEGVHYIGDGVGKPQPVNWASFVGTDGTRLYTGDYERTEQFFAPFMETYNVSADGELDGPTRLDWVPYGTQGMAIVDGDFYFSTSPEKDRPGLRSYLYKVTPEDMEKNNYDAQEGFQAATECYRVPSMSEGMVTHGDKTYLLFESGAATYRFHDTNPPANAVRYIHVGQLGSGDGGGGPGQGNTALSYTGPTSADFHDAFKASARLTGPSGPVSGAKVSFTLGRARSGGSCQATSDSSGVAECSLTPSLRPGTYTLTMRFGGGGGLDPATETVTFTVTKQETALRYTGPKRVANGTPAKLSGRLTEEDTDGAPVSGRKVSLALGRGDDRQDCDATTGDDGKATCTVDKVDQPLNDDATVPVSLDFDGDAYYKPSTERTTVLLEYYTGRSYGVSADVSLAGLGAGVEPTPDTGKVRTARASTHDPGCTASLGVLPLLRAGTLCPEVVTSLAPGTSRAKTAVQDARIGLPGLPLIEVEAATARSTSTCDAAGSSKGSTDLRLRVGGRLIDVTGKVNAEIDLPGTARLVVNEHKPVPGAEHGRTVNAVHLTAAQGTADVVIASATSDVHNCA